MTAHIVVILDRSGSMDTCRKATVDGFDEFVKGQQAAEGDATLTLVQFDDQYEIIYKDKPVDDVVSIKDVYQPRDMTALYDAIGRTIVATKESIVMKSKSQQPDRVIFLIITDGYENASEEYTRPQIAKLVKEQEKGNWEFMFLGANQDAIFTGQSLGMKRGSSLTYDTTHTESVWMAANCKVAGYRGMTNDEMEELTSRAVDMFSEKDRKDLS